MKRRLPISYIILSVLLILPFGKEFLGQIFASLHETTGIFFPGFLGMIVSGYFFIKYLMCMIRLDKESKDYKKRKIYGYYFIIIFFIAFVFFCWLTLYIQFIHK